MAGQHTNEQSPYHHPSQDSRDQELHMLRLLPSVILGRPVISTFPKVVERQTRLPFC